MRKQCKEICKKYALNMQVYTQNMHKIWHYIDINMQNMQNICTKYADICKNMKSYHKCASKLQKMCTKICH